MKSQALMGEDAIMSMLTARCSQKHRQLPILLLVRWARTSAFTTRKNREPPRGTRNQPEKRHWGVTDKVPALISVVWTWSLRMHKPYVYIFDQLESIISLKSAILWALFPVREGNLEIFYLFKPTSSEIYTNTLMKGLDSPPWTTLWQKYVWV